MSDSRAQEPSVGAIHWVYSAYFGTGWYQVNGDRDVYVIRYTPRWELQEADIAEDGTRTIGIELRFPITFGLDTFSFDELPEIVDPDNLVSLSVTPGIDITIPVNDRWALRPYGAVGWGSTFNESDSAWTYWAGVKSRYSFQRGKLNWALLNSVSYVGHTPTVGTADGFWPLMAGLEFDYPLGDYKWGEEQVLLSWHGMYTSYESDMEELRPDGLIEPITDEWEFGFSIHKEDEPIKIWWFKFHRLGLAYRFSSSGDLKGISFVFRSIFDR